MADLIALKHGHPKEGARLSSRFLLHVRWCEKAAATIYACAKANWELLRFTNPYKLEDPLLMLRCHMTLNTRPLPPRLKKRFFGPPWTRLSDTQWWKSNWMFFLYASHHYVRRPHEKFYFTQKMCPTSSFCFFRRVRTFWASKYSAHYT